MFYENDRIVRKQAKYVNSRANDMISDFESKGLKQNEIVAALELLLEDKSNSGFYIDIVSRALVVLKAKESNG